MTLRVWLTALCLGGMMLHAQLNVEFLSNLDYVPILNDIWGYVDEDSTEYALVGMTSGLSIVSLADPLNPQEVQFINGVNSVWRDIKTWGDFAYVTADQGQQGLLMIDLSPLPQDTAKYAFWHPNIPGLGFYNRSHNIWIDEFGLAYLAGSNIGGTLIIDVKADPWNPEFLVKMPLDYAHDVYARDSIVYTSEIYLGQLRAYDISELDNIQLLGFVTTPYAFTHNAWLSDNGNAIFTTDERPNAFIGSYDVSDPTDIKELDRFRPAATAGFNVIPHNVHVWNDYVIISYYTDGCIIVDASRPDNLIEIGNFDTYPEEHGGYNGSWGAYPFLPSGIVLMSDRQHGLFVLAPNYVRGCFLEGNVRDAETQLPVVNAQIEILLEPGDESEVLLPEYSDPQGAFKLGKAVPGTFMIRVSHPDYIEQVLEGVFDNGKVLELQVELMRKPQHIVTGRVVDASSLAGVPFAFVALEGIDRSYQTQADDQGEYLLPAIIEGSYQIYAGNWGMYQVSSLEVFGAVTEDIVIRRGYYDDFLNDFGWSVTGTSQGSQWEPAAPVSELLFETFQCNPAEDLPDDFGPNAFVTGNAGGDAANDDVEQGYTLLSSPTMDLTDLNVPVLSYSPWICERLIEEQVYFVLVSNGSDTVAVDTITTLALGGFWQTPDEIELKGMLEITDQIQVHFLVQDILGTDNVIKAALDRVVVYDAMPSAVSDQYTGLGELRIYPNPVNDILYVILTSETVKADKLVLFNVLGQPVASAMMSENWGVLEIGNTVPSGIFLVQVMEGDAVVGVGSVIMD
ncbi:MAG TPA: choice-of-anchor B family protein [Saprospiraceae bacterium]|nr:choice-of-anchor B family protein [Saprospiraceae bacterium]